jgi:hypothetical protein
MEKNDQETTNRNWKVVAGTAAATGAATVSVAIGIVLYAVWQWFRNPIF